MIKYAIVLPFVYRPYFNDCMTTIHGDLKNNMLTIDNTSTNLGIMKSHNLGVEFMRERGADWLIIMSAAVRFGPKGGVDFIKQIEDHQDHHVIHAASDNVAGGMQANPDGGGGVNEVKGWHLTAFHKSVFDTIGVWDENFSNYGFDDIDLSIRIRKGIPNVKWDTFPCDVHDTRMSHSIHFNASLVGSPSTPRIMYFERKWGRHPNAWQEDAFDHPFNDSSKAFSYWPSSGDALSIQNNEFIILGGDRNA